MKALGTQNFRELCQEYGISAKTGYKWRERLMRQGLEGMAEESRRPRSSPKQLSESQVCEMVKLKLTAQVQLSYPGMVSRLVDKNGTLSWKDQRVFLTSSLAGWQVGLQGTEKGQLEVWFGRLLLGHLDPLNATFVRSDLNPKTPENKELKP